ncbi:MAG: hypothetical protein JW866_09065 [Ignavibacteriales bacterium]|nr:hypothetical protein [Ignavibacteriales bacterium]
MLEWYKTYGRSFPWRETNNPYHILIAEILLQKTNVRKVVDVYEHMIRQFPDIHSLANGDYEEVRKIFLKIGFHYRAHRLIEIAKVIKNDFNGKIPENYEDLIKMKGIGQYIANAILVFAYGQKRVVVDTNVVKVLDKELGYKSDSKRPRNDRNLIEFAKSLAPEHDIKEFNWALLDYGAQKKF